MRSAAEPELTRVRCRRKSGKSAALRGDTSTASCVQLGLTIPKSSMSAVPAMLYTPPSRERSKYVDPNCPRLSTGFPRKVSSFQKVDAIALLSFSAFYSA